MVRSSVKNGADEKVMWKAVAVADELLNEIRESHPEKYEHYMREMSEAINGCHYSEAIAQADVDAMFHTDEKGVKVRGAHWSPDEVENAMAGKQMPNGTTKHDKWVAANAMWHDLCKHYDDAQIIDITYRIFFADEDFPSGGKVWKYMAMKSA